MTPELNNKLKLLFLLLITALPLTIATIAFRLALEGGLSGATVNRGELIWPPADVTDLDMRDESGDSRFRRFEEMIAGIDADDYQAQPWLMVYVTASDCNPACLERIHYLQQLHALLGKDAPRVRRYYLHASAQEIPRQHLQLFREQYPSMGLAFTERRRLEQNLAAAGVEVNLEGMNYVFLVDPVGNVMMYYTDRHSHEDIMSDLDRLLKYSSLG